MGRDGETRDAGRGVTRPEALTELWRLSHRLAPDLAGTARLLEHISTHAEAEALRDYLTDMGARALLDDTEDRA